VLSVVALTLTVMPVNGVAMVAEGPIATSTVTATGKYTYVPASSHTADYYTFEHWYSRHFAVGSIRRLQDQHARIWPPSNWDVDLQSRRDGAQHDRRHLAEFHEPDGSNDDGLPRGRQWHLAPAGVHPSRSSPA
jgi:hypothetical protein